LGDTVKRALPRKRGKGIETMLKKREGEGVTSEFLSSKVACNSKYAPQGGEKATPMKKTVLRCKGRSWGACSKMGGRSGRPESLSVNRQKSEEVRGKGKRRGQGLREIQGLGVATATARSDNGGGTTKGASGRRLYRVS